MSKDKDVKKLVEEAVKVFHCSEGGKEGRYREGKGRE